MKSNRRHLSASAICFALAAFIFLFQMLVNPSLGMESALSFEQEPFITPKIIQDFSCLSDGGDQVVTIILENSQDSNRYFGKIETRANETTKHPFVFTRDDKTEFGYSFVGKTPSGINVLYTEEWGGGSGIFTHLMLVGIKKRTGYIFDESTQSITPQEQTVIEKLCEIPLGDRWAGELTLAGDQLSIKRFPYTYFNGERKITPTIQLKIDSSIANWENPKK